MGWQDRNYGDETYGATSAGLGGVRRPPSGTLGLMILHGVGLAVNAAVAGSVDGGSIPPLVGGGLNPIGVVTHPLATGSLFSAGFVVLAIWSLGGRLEQRLGAGRLIALYAAGNLAGGLAYLASATLWPVLASAPLDDPVGALAGWCALAWVLLRGDRVQVLGRETGLAGVYAVCAAVVAGLVVLRSGVGGLAWLTAAGAGAGGVLLVQRLWGLQGRRAGKPARLAVPYTTSSLPSEAETDIDDVLAKISRDGMDGLSASDRERLEEARRARHRRSR